MPASNNDDRNKPGKLETQEWLGMDLDTAAVDVWLNNLAMLFDNVLSQHKNASEFGVIDPEHVFVQRASGLFLCGAFVGAIGRSMHQMWFARRNESTNFNALLKKRGLLHPDFKHVIDGKLYKHRYMNNINLTADDPEQKTLTRKKQDEKLLGILLQSIVQKKLDHLKSQGCTNLGKPEDYYTFKYDEARKVFVFNLDYAFPLPPPEKKTKKQAAIAKTDEGQVSPGSSETSVPEKKRTYWQKLVAAWDKGLSYAETDELVNSKQKKGEPNKWLVLAGRVFLTAWSILIVFTNSAWLIDQTAISLGFVNHSFLGFNAAVINVWLGVPLAALFAGLMLRNAYLKSKGIRSAMRQAAIDGVNYQDILAEEERRQHDQQMLYKTTGLLMHRIHCMQKLHHKQDKLQSRVDAFQQICSQEKRQAMLERQTKYRDRLELNMIPASTAQPAAGRADDQQPLLADPTAGAAYEKPRHLQRFDLQAVKQDIGTWHVRTGLRCTNAFLGGLTLTLAFALGPVATVFALTGAAWGIGFFVAGVIVGTACAIKTEAEERNRRHDFLDKIEEKQAQIKQLAYQDASGNWHGLDKELHDINQKIERRSKQIESIIEGFSSPTMRSTKGTQIAMYNSKAKQYNALLKEWYKIANEQAGRKGDDTFEKPCQLPVFEKQAWGVAYKNHKDQPVSEKDERWNRTLSMTRPGSFHWLKVKAQWAVEQLFTGMAGVGSGAFIGRLIVSSSAASQGVGLMLGSAIVMLCGGVIMSVPQVFIISVCLALPLVALKLAINAIDKRSRRARETLNQIELTVDKYQAKIEAQQEALALLDDRCVNVQACADSFNAGQGADITFALGKKIDTMTAYLDAHKAGQIESLLDISVLQDGNKQPVEVQAPRLATRDPRKDPQHVNAMSHFAKGRRKKGQTQKNADIEMVDLTIGKSDSAKSTNVANREREFMEKIYKGELDYEHVSSPMPMGMV